jgi:hypothetical protein
MSLAFDIAHNIGLRESLWSIHSSHQMWSNPIKIAIRGDGVLVSEQIMFDYPVVLDAYTVQIKRLLKKGGTSSGSYSMLMHITPSPLDVRTSSFLTCVKLSQSNDGHTQTSLSSGLRRL